MLAAQQPQQKQSSGNPITNSLKRLSRLKFPDYKRSSVVGKQVRCILRIIFNIHILQVSNRSSMLGI